MNAHKSNTGSAIALIVNSIFWAALMLWGSAALGGEIYGVEISMLAVAGWFATNGLIATHLAGLFGKKG